MSIIHKSEEEKLMEKRSKINTTKSETLRAIKEYERLKDKTIEDIKIASKENNEKKVQVFKLKLDRFNNIINGLNDYMLELESIDLHVQIGSTTKQILIYIKQSANDLLKDQLSEGDRSDLVNRIDSIINGENNISDTITTQLDYIGDAIGQIADKNDMSTSESADKEFDNIMDKISNKKSDQ